MDLTQTSRPYKRSFKRKRFNEREPLIRTIVKLRETGYSYAAIADILNSQMDAQITKDVVQKIFKRLSMPQIQVYREKRKVVVAGDVHSRPLFSLTQKIVEEKPDIIVIGGDLFDASKLNSHGRSKGTSLEFKQEITECRNLIKTFLDETNAVIYILKGNHEARLERVLQEILPDEIADYISEIVDLRNLATVGLNDEGRIKIAETINDVGVSPYWMTLGDALISHMNFTSKKPNESVMKLYDWYIKWRRVLKLPDIKCLIQCHTHKFSMSRVEGGEILLAEPGVLGERRIDAYQIVYNGSWIPSVPGAFMFVQEEFSENDASLWKTQLDTARHLTP